MILRKVDLKMDRDLTFLIEGSNEFHESITSGYTDIYRLDKQRSEEKTIPHTKTPTQLDSSST